MEKPEITVLNFPEGKFELVWCLIAQTDGDEIISTFESFIAVDYPEVDFAGEVSERLRLFDENRVFAYVWGLEQFEDIVLNGGWDFKILDYEKENV